LQALRDYQKLISEVDRFCYQIRQKYGKYIAFKKGCPGNCCQRHITVFPIEAAVFARALRHMSQEMAGHIQRKARQSTSAGPCPLLEEGACLMYDSRAIICRTHGYPIASEYNGHRNVGFCHKNFKNLAAISDDRIIELAPLNKSLAALNRRFVREYDGRLPATDRLTVGEALLMDHTDQVLTNQNDHP
jgi:Fe-S-cluster containining protein